MAVLKAALEKDKESWIADQLFHPEIDTIRHSRPATVHGSEFSNSPVAESSTKHSSVYYDLNTSSSTADHKKFVD